ncbi:MAG: hypothetical protein R3322_14580 [Kiloniellales bacterium]|jgi:hypothetical protein|nr:hypothetical protein [Kiloniellales bacterium]
MTFQIDIYRTASALLREHGDDADLVATRRAEAMGATGSLNGQRVWRCVVAAIKEIQRKDP